jgi:hypothetical protein
LLTSAQRGAYDIYRSSLDQCLRTVHQQFALTIFPKDLFAPMFFALPTFAKSKENKSCRESLIGDPFLQSTLKLLN